MKYHQSIKIVQNLFQKMLENLSAFLHIEFQGEYLFDKNFHKGKAVIYKKSVKISCEK